MSKEHREMIQLSQITHEDRRGNLTYVLPGCVHTDRPFYAIDMLSRINALIIRTQITIASRKSRTVSKSGAVMTRVKCDNARLFLGG